MSALSANAKEFIPSDSVNTIVGNQYKNTSSRKKTSSNVKNKTNNGTKSNGNKKSYPSRRSHYKNQQDATTKKKTSNNNNSKKGKNNSNKNNKKSQQQQINSAFLGFKYEREKDDGLGYYFPSTVTNKRNQNKVQHAVFDRNVFLKAAYRFVVSGPSACETNNPYMLSHNNKKIDWNDVEQVLFDLEHNSDFSCPICLCEPEVPLMNCCGHVYCMLCVLRLLKNSNRKNWVKCPICNDPITKEKLRPTEPRYITSIKPTTAAAVEGNKKLPKSKNEKSHSSPMPTNDAGTKNTVTFNLMFRNKTSTRSSFAYSATMTDEEWNNVLQYKMPTVKLRKKNSYNDSGSKSKQHVMKNNTAYNEKEQLLEFTQFLRCTKEYMKTIICKQINELNRVTTEAKQDANFLAIIGKYEDSQKENDLILHLDNTARQILAEKALRWELHDLIETIVESENNKNTKTNRQILDEEEYPVLGGRSNTNTSKNNTLNTSIEKQSNNVNAVAAAVATEEQQPVALNKIGSPDTGFYFYQFEDGSKTFLHPFCVNLLKHEYKTYNNFPSKLQPTTVLDIETVTLTKDKAKFFKYLSHLNLNAEIKLIEVDLKQYISQQTKNKFKKELQKRKRDRDKKMKEKKKNGNKLIKSRDCPSPEMISAKLEKERTESLAPKNFPSVGSPPKITLKEPAIPAAYLNIGKKVDKSFANITKTMGFFPTLGEAAKTATTKCRNNNVNSKPGRAMMSGSNVWGGANNTGGGSVWGKK